MNGNLYPPVGSRGLKRITITKKALTKLGVENFTPFTAKNDYMDLPRFGDPDCSGPHLSFT